MNKNILDNIKDGFLTLADSAKEEGFNYVGTYIAENIPMVGYAANAAGFIAPRFGTLFLGFKQNQFERNINELILQLGQNFKALEERIIRYEESQSMDYFNWLFEILADNAIQSKRKKKIRFMTYGFLNISNQKSFNPDKVINYYDILDQLTLIDIKALRFIFKITDKEYKALTYNQFVENFSNSLSISRGECNYILNKLTNLGILDNLDAQHIEESLMILNENMGMDYEPYFPPGQDPFIEEWPIPKLSELGAKFYNFFIEFNES